MTLLQREQQLEQKYVNKVVQLTYYTRMESKVFTGKIDRLALDVTRKGEVSVQFSGGQRFWVPVEDFSERVIKLN